MNSVEFFNALENTGNHYSYFKKGRKYVYFSTGGWSDNEHLISELQKEPIFHFLLIKWESGGHYTFEIPSKEVLEMDIQRKQEKVEE